MIKVSALIPSAGYGTRMGRKTESKSLLLLMEKPIISHTISAFQTCEEINEIMLIVPRKDIDSYHKIIKKEGFNKVRDIIVGGQERQYSVYNGIKCLSEDTDIVVIHDGVRPLVNKELIIQSIEKAKRFGSGVVGVPFKDTAKLVDEKLTVKETINREKLWIIQTPQAFTYSIIMDAYKKAMDEGFLGTDDSTLVERAGYPVHIVSGSYENIKITTPEDLIIAETILRSR